MLFNNDDSDGSPLISMMGIQNALRTGNMVADVVIAMCVPVVLKIVFVWVEKFGQLCDLELLLSWFEKESMMYERFISHVVETRSEFSNTNLDEDSQNAVLHKAIKVYLHQVVKLDLRSAYMDLTMLKEEESNCDNDDDSYEDDLFGSHKTVAGQLSRYKILNGLPYSQWHDLGRYGKANGLVQLRIKFSNTIDGGDETQNGGNTKNLKNTTFHFISNEKDAIDAFVDSAYKWYLAMLRKMEDNSRFYYEMKVPDITSRRDSGHDRQSSSIRYKQYKLSDQKTFESLFFREKDSLLALIDHFTAKTGKYGIKGYPHKLGLLLHGPPGTGKTSLIKALAQYTGRSIVNVPLSRVLTNSELMSVFFDRRFRLEDSYYSAILDFDDIIYVMEDCDAASHVVKKRSGAPSTESGSFESITLPNPKSVWRLLLESTVPICRKVVKALLEKSERLKEEADKERPKVLCSIARHLNEQPALGLIKEASDDPLIYRACTDAMESADATKKQQRKLDEILTTHAEAIMMLLESGADVNDEFVDELVGETRSLKCHVSPCTPQTLTQPKPSTACMGLQRSEPATIPTDESFTDSKKEISFGGSFFTPNPDALSLSGLLNVLDGVVDTPGRIVILTSNHPELLDPALIRPGRVDKVLKLGYMEAPDIVKMLELYYQMTLSGSDVARVGAAVGGLDGDAKSKLRMTPAQIEQLTSEHDKVDDMIRLLEEKSSSVLTKTGILETEQISSSRI